MMSAKIVDMNKPLIGIALDTVQSGDYSTYPYYVLREHYFDAIEKAGGIPVGLPLISSNVDDYVERLDGLLMPGGDYDIPPSMYGEEQVHETVVIKTERLDFDIAITKKFLEINKPILGICAGEQLLAVLMGGTLIQDIKSETESEIEHYVDMRTVAAHEINIKLGTVLHQIIGDTTMQVNSHHHQAVKEVSEKFIASAWSDDDIIEAIEIPGKKFCLGVEWHPEFLANSKELSIFKAFVNACK